MNPALRFTLCAKINPSDLATLCSVVFMAVAKWSKYMNRAQGVANSNARKVKEGYPTLVRP